MRVWILFSRRLLTLTQTLSILPLLEFDQLFGFELPSEAFTRTATATELIKVL
jgi:hypothetical protein